MAKELTGKWFYPQRKKEKTPSTRMHDVRIRYVAEGRAVRNGASLLRLALSLASLLNRPCLDNEDRRVICVPIPALTGK